MAEPGVVTPEAVVLAFETAGLGSRVIAEVIDLVVQGAAVGLIAIGGGLLHATSVGLAVVYFGLFLVVFGYPIAMETLWRGRTLGKAAMGLRVVTVEGAPERFRHALIRGALGLIDFWATSGGAAVLCILVTKRNQRLGDLVAGTLVLRERTGAQSLAAATFWVPSGWEGYAATLDVNAVTAADYQAIRSFLLRAGTLDPWTRDRLAREIATAVLPRLHHQPPPGVSAEMFLLCVAARYQARQRRSPPSRSPSWPDASPPAAWSPTGEAPPYPARPPPTGPVAPLSAAPVAPPAAEPLGRLAASPPAAERANGGPGEEPAAAPAPPPGGFEAPS